MIRQTTCPDPDQWREFLDEDLPAEDQGRLNVHLEACLHCQEMVNRLSDGGEQWRQAAGPRASLRREAALRVEDPSRGSQDPR